MTIDKQTKTKSKKHLQTTIHKIHIREQNINLYYPHKELEVNSAIQYSDLLILVVGATILIKVVGELFVALVYE